MSTSELHHGHHHDNGSVRVTGKLSPADQLHSLSLAIAMARGSRHHVSGRGRPREGASVADSDATTTATATASATKSSRGIEMPSLLPLSLSALMWLRTRVRQQRRAAERVLVQEGEDVSGERYGEEKEGGGSGSEHQASYRGKEESQGHEKKERERVNGSGELERQPLASLQRRQEHEHYRKGGRASVMPMRSPEACWSKVEQPFYHTVGIA